MNTLEWLSLPVKDISQHFEAEAEAHQNTLTKPPGSLGYLEDYAVRFCGWQNTVRPKINNVAVRIFSGDHGVCVHNISAFPQAVTAQMVKNFIEGGAAVRVLSDIVEANFKVVNLGTVEPVDIHSPFYENQFIAAKTADFTCAYAMTEEQLVKALNVGKQVVDNIDADVFVGGEMGIGNSSSASAMFSVLLEIPSQDICGPGTGLDALGIERKSKVIDSAVAFHQHKLNDPLSVLQVLGGFEIAALCGAYLRCAQRGIPIVVDGFICSAAALIAIELRPSVKRWMIFSHLSSEPGHKKILRRLNVKPVLDLGMRLGEGSGATLAVQILKSALALHNGMATFDRAKVAKKLGGDDVDNAPLR